MKNFESKFKNVYGVLEDIKSKIAETKKELTFATTKKEYNEKLEDLQILEKQLYIINDSLDIMFEYYWISE